MKTPGTIREIVAHWAVRTPEAPAIVRPDRPPVSYRDLLTAIDALGSQLNAHGLGRTDRVAILHPGGPDMAMATAAIWSYATVVPLNPKLTSGEFALALRDYAVKALVIADGMDTPARAVAARLGLPVLDLAGPAPEGTPTFSLTGKGTGRSAASGPATCADPAIILTTSGTTSHSKIVPLRQSHLATRAKLNSDFLGLTASDRALNMMPLFHGGGLSAGLSSCWFVGSSVCPLPDFGADTFYRHLDVLEPTYVMGPPAVFYGILDQAHRFEEVIERARPRLRMIRTGAGKLDRALVERLEDVFQAPIIQVYGSSESGWMACDPLPPATRKPGSVGLPRQDEVAVMDENGRLLPAGETGEIVARGAAVFDGYENDAETGVATFTDGWYRTGDLGYFDRDNYLFLTGRIRETINRGGQKINPNEVDEALLAARGIAEAATFPIPHTTLGEEVAAAVVLETGAAWSEAELSHKLKQHLAAYKVPRRILFVDAIPKGPTGKVQRHRLADGFGISAGAPAQSRNASTESRPPTTLEATLQKLWAESLHLDSVGLHDNFFLLGGDSLQAVELFLRIERELGRRLPRTVLFEAGTVAEMAAALEADLDARCLVPIQPRGHRPRIFCVHGIDGDVLYFRDLARHLGDSQPFYGLRSQGLAGDRSPGRSIPEIAACYIDEIKRVEPHGPYVIGGYSFGGWVAHEMACQMRRAGHEVALLVLIDTPCIDGRPNLQLRTRLAWARQYALAAARSRRGGALIRESILTALRLKFLSLASRTGIARQRLENRLRRYPAEAHGIALTRHRPDLFDGNAVLLHSEHATQGDHSLYQGWTRLITGSLVMKPVTGSHYEMMYEPNVAALARELASCLTADERAIP